MAKHLLQDRHDCNFSISYTKNADGSGSWDIHHINTVLLYEILAEMKSLNALLHCTNFQQIPCILRDIRRQTVPKVRKPRKAKEVVAS